MRPKAASQISAKRPASLHLPPDPAGHLKIVVSPVRVWVLPWGKVLQICRIFGGLGALRGVCDGLIWGPWPISAQEADNRPYRVRVDCQDASKSGYFCRDLTQTSRPSPVTCWLDSLYVPRHRDAALDTVALARSRQHKQGHPDCSRRANGGVARDRRTGAPSRPAHRTLSSTFSGWSQ